MKTAIDILLLALVAFYFVALFRSARGGSMRIGTRKKDKKTDEKPDDKLE